MAEEKPSLHEFTRSDPLWFVCSYPKSGNTWVRSLLYYYAGETDISHHLTRANDLDGYTYAAVSPKPVSQLSSVELIQLRGAAMMHLRIQKEGPLAVKSHYLNGSMGGLPMFSPVWCDKAIHVVRDPREVAPSFADHAGMSIDETIDLMGRPEAQLMGPAAMSHMLHTWSVHTASWLTADNVDTITVTYAGLHRDTAGELRRIIEHLELDVDEEAIEHAVRESRFAKMRAQEEKNGFAEASSNQERFFRRGVAGGWEDELTAEQVGRIEDEHGEMMAELDAIGGISDRKMGELATVSTGS